MKKYKLITLWTTILLGLVSTTNAVSVWTLKWKIWDDDVSQEMTQIDWNYSFLDIISVVNNYLWFAIWFLCFLFMIWNGFQLIMARGNEKDMEAAKNALIWCGIGLVVCFLAYIIVNIAINLFRIV